MLFVGEGNFSFSESVARRLAEEKKSGEIVSTCYEDNPVSELAEDNIKKLQELGAKVVLSVDATALNSYFSDRFDLVVFMFPHIGGKMKIQKNRDLLRKFGVSAREVLSNKNGRVVVTLCAGQGGTAYDTVARGSEADTWQVTKMMAEARLQAVEIHRLEEVEAEGGYKSYGYRSMDKGFNVDRGVVHVFRVGCEDVVAALDNSPFLEDKLEALKGHGDSPVSKYIGEILEMVKTEVPNIKVLEPSERDSKSLEDFFEQTRDENPSAQVIVSPDYTTKDFCKCPLSIYLALQCDEKCIQNLHFRQDFPTAAASATDNFAPFDLTPALKGLVCLQDWREAWARMPNLSPPAFSHDLSFWRPMDEEGKVRPDFAVVRRLFWEVGGDFVSSLSLVEEGYRREEPSPALSMTVRIGYRSFRFSLNPAMAWRLHLDILGGALIKQFGVHLR